MADWAAGVLRDDIEEKPATKDYASSVLGEGGAAPVKRIPRDQIEGSVFSSGLSSDDGFLKKQLNAAKVGAGFFLNADEAARADIIRNTLPNAQFGQDENGRTVVRGSDKEPYRYINAPGIGAQDVTDFGGDIVKFAPAAKVATLGKGLLSRMLLGGGAAATTSAAADELSGVTGSEQGINYGKAAFAGAGGAAAEPLSSGLALGARGLGDLIRRVRGGSQTVGNVSEEALKRFDADAISQARLTTQGAQTADDVARSEFGIQLSRGQATGNLEQQAFESAALRGGKGTPAQEALQRFADAQRGQVREAGASIASPAGRLTDSLNQSGSVIKHGIKGRAAALKESIDQAYAVARDHNATLSAEAVPDLANSIIRGAPEEIRYLLDADPRSAMRSFPQATTAIRSTQRLVGEIRRKLPEDGVITAVDFRRIEAHRKLLNSLANDAAPEDARAVRLMKASLDGWLDTAVNNKLFQGDEAFLTAMKEARALRTQYGKLFESNGPKDFAGKVMDDIVRNDATPEETLNLLFGASELGAKRGVAETVRQLKQISGETGEEFIALREAAVDRIMAKGFGRGGDQMRIGTLIESWEKALNGSGKSVMEEMFTAKEIARMNRYVAVLKKLEPKAGAVNTSNSTIEAMRQARGILGAFVKIPQLASARVLTGVADPNAIRASQSITGAPRPLPSLPAPSAALVPAGAPLLTPPSENEQRNR